MTKRAPASMCFARSSRSLKAPVHSNTTSTPICAPRQLGRVPFAQNGIILAVNIQAVFLRADIPRPSSVHGVEFQQIGEIIGRNTSLTAVRRRVGLSSTIFRVALPILPKPLIATFNIRTPLLAFKSLRALLRPHVHNVFCAAFHVQQGFSTSASNEQPTGARRPKLATLLSFSLS